MSATVNSTQWVCVEGTAAAGFDELCAFTCKYGYCPVGACLCTKMGPGNKLPGPETPGFGTMGFPAKGRTASYGGLCSFACNYGYGCPQRLLRHGRARACHPQRVALHPGRMYLGRR